MVNWTAHARDQLRLLHQQIAQDSPIYATRVCEELVNATLGLDDLPGKGRMVPELRDEAIREVSLYSYRILYEIKADNAIEVLALIHKRRNLEPDDIPR